MTSNGVSRVSDWPGTGRFKTIRLVNISVEGSMRSEILCYRRISTRDWKHHECRCNVGIAIGTHCICYSSCQFEPVSRFARVCGLRV